ncbi:MAG: hypothetical protein A07HN63_01421 [uncultured archaeon A07HN63]|nr:MAG: hypothetical protein A07HN63_01421 [uncultured archaeon A07HN63]
MSQPPQPPLRGADRAVVRAALAADDPLPGASGVGPAAMGGFAGRVDDRLVRDVFGRQPIYSESDADDPTADGAWAFTPDDLADPEVVPPGTVRTTAGDEQLLTLP